MHALMENVIQFPEHVNMKELFAKTMVYIAQINIVIQLLEIVMFKILPVHYLKHNVLVMLDFVLKILLVVFIHLNVKMTICAHLIFALITLEIVFIQQFHAMMVISQLTIHVIQ